MKLNRKTRWRKIRRSRIRETDKLMRLWGNRYIEAKQKGDYPPNLLSMMFNRATYWILAKGDAISDKQTPMKKGKHL